MPYVLLAFFFLLRLLSLDDGFASLVTVWVLESMAAFFEDWLRAAVDQETISIKERRKELKRQWQSGDPRGNVESCTTREDPLTPPAPCR